MIWGLFFWACNVIMAKSGVFVYGGLILVDLWGGLERLRDAKLQVEIFDARISPQI